MILSLTFLQLENLASRERLAKYLRLAENDEGKVVELYLKNLEECRRFYGLLHWLEIGLRNAMNRELTAAYGERWFESKEIYFYPEEFGKIRIAKIRLEEQHKRVENPDVVAAISLGFWVNLFNGPYDQLWRYHLRKTFQGRTDSMKRHEATSQLKPILNLRNRVAHYEPILNMPLEKLEADIFRVLGWIDPALKRSE